jgi:ABC-type proline/glycine betaine transport system substrate-binding protein
MAYMNQEKKAKIATILKPIMKKYGVKGSLSVRNHSTICLTLKSGSIDFVENYILTDAEKPYAKHFSEDQVAYIRKNQSIDVNPYWFQDHFTGKAKSFLTEAFAAMKGAGWYDNSDAMTDYFDTAYYVDVNIGKWNKPYMLTA